MVNIPQFVLSGLKVDFCLKFKYLGHVLVESWDDAKDMGKELKLLYIRTNKLIGKFSFCSHNVKKVLWNSYLTCIYGAGLWHLSSRNRGMYIVAFSECIKRFFSVSKYERNRVFYFDTGMLTPNTILHDSVCTVKRFLGMCGACNNLVEVFVS